MREFYWKTLFLSQNYEAIRIFKIIFLQKEYMIFKKATPERYIKSHYLLSKY